MFVDVFKMISGSINQCIGATHCKIVPLLVLPLAMGATVFSQGNPRIALKNKSANPK